MNGLGRKRGDESERALNVRENGAAAVRAEGRSDREGVAMRAGASRETMLRRPKRLVGPQGFEPWTNGL